MRKQLFAAPLLSLLIAGAAFAGGSAATQTVSHDTELNRNLYVFNSIVKNLEENYVDTIRGNEAFRAAVAAMLNTVDPYTEYYASDDRETLERMSTGVNYGGIGSFVLGRDGWTYISEPITGSPSQVAGMRAGDRITRVDTTAVAGLTTDQVTKLLRGEAGTPVKVEVVRPYVADSLLTFDLIRERVVQPSVDYYSLSPAGIGYLKLNSYIDRSPAEVADALDSLSAAGLKSLILDLRGNGGGLVNSAVDILGNFLPKGTEALRTRGRDNTENKVYKTSIRPRFPDLPLVVLIDGGSASSSEITAGALQDLDRAVLVGSRSFGKGLVQSTLQLPYDGVLKVTTAKYYIPSGRLIQALDYSHRNPDGSVAPTPDSLTHEYTTRAGRIVRDGGGLTPDSVVSWGNTSRLLYNLVMAHQIFDYANRYVNTHPAPAKVSDLTMTDEMWSDFVAGVDTTKMRSDKIGMEYLKNLRSEADNEGFMTDELKEALNALEPLLQPDLQRDLNNKRKEVSEFIVEELADRYFGGKGRTAVTLLNDPGYDAAVAILSDPALYRRMLAPQPRGKGKDKMDPDSKQTNNR